MGGDSTGERRVGVREVRLRMACLVAVGACAAALAYALAARVSTSLGVLAAVVTALGFLRLLHTNLGPLRRKLDERTDAGVFRDWCRAGMMSPGRRLYRLLPSDPRCRLCLVPFRGVGRLLGMRPSRKNPNFCPS